jgi:hypothetical protein
LLVVGGDNIVGEHQEGGASVWRFRSA